MGTDVVDSATTGWVADVLSFKDEGSPDPVKFVQLSKAETLEQRQRQARFERLESVTGWTATVFVVLVFVLPIVAIVMGLGRLAVGVAIGGMFAAGTNSLLSLFFHEKAERVTIGNAEYAYRSDVITALFEKLPKDFSTNPIHLVVALNKLTNSQKGDDSVVEYGIKDDILVDLLHSDEFSEKVIEVIYTVAATENPETLKTGRRVLREYVEEYREKLSREAAAKHAAAEAEAEQARLLAAAQPDYSEHLLTLRELDKASRSAGVAVEVLA